MTHGPRLFVLPYRPLALLLCLVLLWGSGPAVAVSAQASSSSHLSASAQIGEGAEAAQAQSDFHTELPPSPPGLEQTAVGHKAGESAAVREFQEAGLPLQAGWNLVSLPEELAETDPAVVLSSIAGHFNLVYAYDGCDQADPWKLYDPAAPPVVNDLTRLDYTQGFWIDMQVADTLEISGTARTRASFPLCAGWNLVGYPFQTAQPLTQALYDIQGKYDRVYAFDPTDAADPWALFDTAIPDWANDLRTLKSGFGYWIHATEPTSFALSELDLIPPQVAIVSPVVDAVGLKAQTPITGTAYDDNLDYYLVETAPAGTNYYQTVVSATTPVSQALLTRLDTTLYPNGLYDLRLTALDRAGNSSVVTQTVQIQGGENKPGHFSMTFTDLTVHLAGIPIQIFRTYDSRRRALPGDFGYGWRLDVGKQGVYINNRELGDGWVIASGGGFFNPPCSISNEVKDHITEVRFSDTEFYHFALEANFYGFGSTIFGGCLGDVSFRQVGGIPGAQLYVLGDNSVFYSPGDNQLYEDLTQLAIFDPQDVRLVTRDGREYDLNLENGLERIGDANGNSLFIEPGRISHSSGRSIQITRNGAGAITVIRDPLGAFLRYEYDGAGDLSISQDRLNNRATYTYTLDHYLTEIRDPLGNVPLRNEYDPSGRLVAQIDAVGNRTEIETDVTANQVVVTDRTGISTTLTYNDDGHVTDVAGAGLALQRDYDEQGNKVRQTDPLGHTRTFSYTAENDLKAETDGLGNLFAYQYDGEGRLNQLQDPAGNSTDFTFDPLGNVSTMQDAKGVVQVDLEYDGQGNPTRMRSLGGVIELTYDGFGNLTRKVGPGEAEITFTYDSNGNLLSQNRFRTVNLGSGGNSRVSERTTYTYDANGNVTAERDQLGNITRYAYDANDRLISVTDPLGGVTRYGYDDRGYQHEIQYCDGTTSAKGYDLEGRVTAQADRAGRTTFYTYDDQGQLVRTLYPDGSHTQTVYDGAGNPVQLIDERGATTQQNFDANRRLLSVTDPLGNATAYQYSVTGARTTVTDPLGNVTRYVYDESLFGNPRPITVTLADGSRRVQQYDASGRTAGQLDEASHLTRYAYDSRGNLAVVTGTLGTITAYLYDEADNLVRIEDARGNVTVMTYDANGNLLSRTLPTGEEEFFTYDRGGRQLTHQAFDGRTTRYTYDCNGHRLQTVLPGGSMVQAAYSPTGQTLAITDTTGVLRYAYDARDRVVRAEKPDGSMLDYSYDLAGHRTAVTTTVDGQAFAVFYTYDLAGRLVTVTDASGETRLTYDGAGNRTGILYPNGVRTAYTYDSRHRLTGIEHRDGSNALLASFAYNLDPTGARTRLTESGGRTVDYTYDALYRLTAETDSVHGLTTYSYDEVGNRTQMAQGGVTTRYLYDAADRLLSRSTGVITHTYTYDGLGNLIQDDDGGTQTTYAYDVRSRLISQVQAGTVTTYTYDALGNRISRGINGALTRFVVDSFDLSGLPQVVTQAAPAGTLTRYTYGDGLISQRRGGNSHFYGIDGTGSTRLLTDGTGAVADTYTFDAFGNLLASTGSTSNDFLFGGEQYDPNLGFYYLRARYMDPANGRFIGPDPFAGSPYDPASLHRYSYAHNNPVNRSDPTGLFTLAGISISLSISGILSAISIGYTIYKEVKDIKDKLDVLLTEIPQLKLNKSADRDTLLQREIVITVDSDGISTELNRNLGEGAVAKSYDIAVELMGTGGEYVAFMWAFAAGYYMAQLPAVDDKPAHYLSCGFNDFIFHTYELELVNGVASGTALRPALRVIGAYISYFNFLALMGSTVGDLGSGRPPEQPAGGACPLPGSGR